MVVQWKNRLLIENSIGRVYVFIVETVSLIFFFFFLVPIIERFNIETLFGGYFAMWRICRPRGIFICFCCNYLLAVEIKFVHNVLVEGNRILTFHHLNILLSPCCVIEMVLLWLF